MSLLKLFFIYVKIGAILLGGGYVILPILSHEFVEKRSLITQNELTDYFALSQSLPGIIAANMSIFIGYKLCGKMGAIVAMIGIITVPFLIIVFLASMLDLLVGNIYVQSALWGVGIGVIALIILTFREMLQNSKKDLYFYIIFLLSFLSIIWFNLPPIKTILIYSVLGVSVKRTMEGVK